MQRYKLKKQQNKPDYENYKIAMVHIKQIKQTCVDWKFPFGKDVTYARKKLVGFYYPWMIAKFIVHIQFYTYDSSHFVK